jgi:hypothetical protein
MAVFVQLVGSRWGVGVEGLLEQWVQLTRVLFGDESFHFVQQLHVQLFIGVRRDVLFVDGAIFMLMLEDVENVCQLRVVVFDVACVFLVA